MPACLTDLQLSLCLPPATHPGSGAARAFGSRFAKQRSLRREAAPPPACVSGGAYVLLRRTAERGCARQQGVGVRCSKSCLGSSRATMSGCSAAAPLWTWQRQERGSRRRLLLLLLRAVWLAIQSSSVATRTACLSFQASSQGLKRRSPFLAPAPAPPVPPALCSLAASLHFCWL